MPVNSKKKLIIKLWKEGKTEKEISKRTGLSQYAVYHSIAAAKAGKTRKGKWKKMIRSFLVLECTPKKDNLSEGTFLNELVEMVNGKPHGPHIQNRFVEASNRDNFIGALRDAEEGIIHISAHGGNSAEKGPIISLASTAEIKISELEELWRKDPNKSRLIFLSACEVGQEDLAKAFRENGIRYFIAPAEKVYWYDAATFLAIFYRLLLVEKNKSPWMAFRTTTRFIKKAFPTFSGKWRFFENGDERMDAQKRALERKPLTATHKR